MVIDLLSFRTKAREFSGRCRCPSLALPTRAKEKYLLVWKLRITGFGRKEVLASVLITAPETVQVISSSHRPEWQCLLERSTLCETLRCRSLSLTLQTQVTVRVQFRFILL